MTDFALWGNAAGLDNLCGTLGESVSGMAPLTKPGSNNTKSGWTELNAGVPRDYCGFYVQFGNNHATQAVTTSLVDIGFGTTVVVPNMLAFGRRTAFMGFGDIVYFPIPIPAGTQLQARLQSLNVAGGTPGIRIWGVPNNPLRQPPSYGRVTNYGANTADSGGVGIDNGTPANTWVRTQIVASITNPIKHLIVCIGDQDSARATVAKFLFDIEIGAGNQVIASNLSMRTSSQQNTLRPQYWQFPVNIPAGTSISINSRCTSNNTLARVYDVVLLGID